MKVAFLINRIVKNYDNVVNTIHQGFSGWEYKIFISDYPGHISLLAKQAIEEKFEIIITVGGDGTHNETINGVMSHFKTGEGNALKDYDLESVKQIKLGLLPAGTGNDFSRTIQVSFDVNRLKSLIESGSSHLVDIGFTSFYDKNLRPTTRFFVNITDVGMGGEVVRKLENKLPLLSNQVQYGIRIATTFLTYKKSHIKAHADGWEWKGNVMNFIVANGKWFGSGLGVAPEAEINDGQFEIAILGNINIFDYVKNLNTVKQCVKVEHPEVKYHRLSEITIAPADRRPLAIDMDGEYAGFAPITLTNVSKVLNFIY